METISWIDIDFDILRFIDLNFTLPHMAQVLVNSIILVNKGYYKKFVILLEKYRIL